jgi:membrane-associated protease RseP (regulator of RpoE activity)
MRLWRGRRRPASPSPSPDDLWLTEDLVRRNIEDVFAVRESAIRGGVLVFRGALRGPPAPAVDALVTRLRPFGFTPFLAADGGDVVLQAWPLAEAAERRGIGVNVALFVLTVLSTLVAGSGAFFAFDPFAEPARLLDGVPFAFTLLAILGVHEFGHYFTARRYRASVSLPYFIPAPPPFIFGTLGAIIRMRSPARDRNALFDIAAAGPLAGLVVAIPALIIGLEWSTVARVPAGDYLVFGDSLLMSFLVYLRFGPIPEGWDVFVHPVALAGWVGLFVTALNLFPVGQLDGGRIAYALFGRHHRTVGLATFAALLVLGVVTGAVNWVVWAALLLFLIGFQHTPPLDDVTPLTPSRRAVGVFCLVLLVLLIPPVPISIG